MSKSEQTKPVYIGNTPQQPAAAQASGEYLSLQGEDFYRIRDVDAMEPFFMSLVSSSDHWLFVASTGGLTAGRVSAEQALFPYYTVDKITENADNTGPLAVLLVPANGRRQLWEPFSTRQQGVYRLQRNLYKNVPGTTLIFEEINLDLDLTYRYAWRTSDQYGFVKTTWVVNGASTPREIELLDGVLNLLPANISSSTQVIFSVLLDAYKRSEVDPQTGMGIFALSSNLTDLAEPSEALLATTVFQVGLDRLETLLSTQQIDTFRRGGSISLEREVRGRRPAYLTHAKFLLSPGAQRSWHLVAEVCQDHSKIVALRKALLADPGKLAAALEADLAANRENLVQIVASSDGLQLTQEPLSTSHHFANVLFNVMRGGIFAEGNWVRSADLREYINVHRPALLSEESDFFKALPDRILVSDLQARAGAAGSLDLERLCAAYLPLTFSRRHGDPSRPWNQFAINVKKPDGSQRLDYQGNWRDIFQNWEALAWSYPEFVENMLTVFLNATTVDGYNPYRVTRNGIDWEMPEPNNPWANIGYWSDHQVIYLLKLMEISTKVHPGKLQQWLARPAFSYANVPYRIKKYADLLHDPFNTIEFNWDLERKVEKLVRETGQDGKLVRTPDEQVYHGNLGEKLLTLLLAKLVNFVPQGGIWMNTQRPEWNDANNALVGKGLSVVTLNYLRRYIVFCRELFNFSGQAGMDMLQEVAAFLTNIESVLQRFKPVLSGRVTDEQRREVMDALGQAGSDYRWDFYTNSVSGKLTHVSTAQVVEFLDLALAYVEHTLRLNKRGDNLFHSYNILHLGSGTASVTYLSEMLEGQVAVLSSGLLTGEESLALLDSLRAGPLYRADQHSYILYPDRELPGFLEKNRIPHVQARELELVKALTAAQDRHLVVQDRDGDYHFAGSIRNIKDVNRALSVLASQPRFAELVAVEGDEIRKLFETVFHHNQFTGRSGSFFAYEGLGSIYWHMVSKLLLAVQETALHARDTRSDPALCQALKDHYIDIRLGLGFHKSPAVYGAFPTDPYSHTPKGQGAKQPGMTGQVKEEVLTRQAEVGLRVRDGRLVFDPFLLDPQELLTQPAEFAWTDVSGRSQVMQVLAGSLGYTLCQVPVLMHVASKPCIEVHRTDGKVESIPENVLDAVNSQHIFQRDGLVHHLVVTLISP